MGIQNFPASLVPIIQQGFLEREFRDPLTSKLGYRMIADREEFAIGIGETLTKTRTGLKASATTPLAPSTNTNLDNGLTPSGWSVEQYTLTINQYGDTQDLNMVTSRVGLANQFLVNAKVNGEQAARTLDELARNALFSVYLGGNTRVRTTLGANGPTIAVDDVRGFKTAFLNGVSAAVSGGNTLAVTVGSNVYALSGFTTDGTNASTALAAGGQSGTLTFTTSVTVADGTAGNAVQGGIAPSVIRPSGRLSTGALLGTDVLTMSSLLDAVAQLRSNAVPTVNGAYNCYVDPTSVRELFADQDFQRLFQGATTSNAVFRNGVVSDMLGLRFITTTEAYIQAHPSLAGVKVHRPIICGQGALIEGDFAGMASSDIAPTDSIVSQQDGVVMVTREPLDRLQQIIAQSWYWIGGFTAPSDTTANSTTISTANNAAYKRAVVLEHV